MKGLKVEVFEGGLWVERPFLGQNWAFLGVRAWDSQSGRSGQGKGGKRAFRGVGSFTLAGDPGEIASSPYARGAAASRNDGGD